MPTRTQLAALAVLVSSIGCGYEPAIDPPQDPAVIRAARQFAARLDYIAADYPLSMVGGRVAIAAEYEEQLDYLDEAVVIGEVLPNIDAAKEVEPIIQLVEAKASPVEVANAANALADRALSVHNVVIAPLGDPQYERAKGLFRENCAKCHGQRGAGDGPEADKQPVRPRSFLDADIMEPMSPRRVFSATTDGIERAQMPQFDLLSADDRWSLAFYVLTLRWDDTETTEPARGASLTLEQLANTRDADLRIALGDGDPGLAWVRRIRPFGETTGALAAAQAAVALAVTDHRAGRRAEAESRIDAALIDSLSAYRPALTTRNSARVRNIERALYDLRAAIPGGASPALEQRGLAVRAEMRAAARTASQIHPMALAGAATLAALGWMIVLLFLGNEAARAVCVDKAARAIHVGWAVAAVTGLTTLLAVSASGELTEASSRHQVIAVLRILAVLAGLGAIGVLVRRLAIATPLPAPNSGPLPWWLAGLSFVCAYGSVLEWSHHLGHLSAETGKATWLLALAGVIAATALVAFLWLLLELVRRAGRAPTYAVVAVAGLLAVTALAGSAVRGLIDGGTLPAHSLGQLRLDLLGVTPQRFAAIAQLATVGIAVLITGWGVLVSDKSK